MRIKSNLRSITGVFAVLFLLVVTWVLLPVASSQEKGGNTANQQVFENFDIRYSASGMKQKAEVLVAAERSLSSDKRDRADKRGEEMREAEQQLSRRISNLRVEYNDELGSPQIVDVKGGARFLTEASDRDPETVVRDFLQANGTLYGLSTEELGQFETRAVYTNPDGKITWVNLERRINGLPVFRSELTAALTQKGELVRTVGDLTGGLVASDMPTTASVTAQEAIAKAAETIGVTVDPGSLVISSQSPDGTRIIFEPGPFSNEIVAELQYFPLATGIAELSWGLQLWKDVPAYLMVVGGDKGDVYFRKNMVSEQTQPATYNAYGSDSPAPLSPLLNLNSATVPVDQGAAVARTSFTLITENTPADPWLNDGDNTTTGNNVDSGMDLVAPGGIDAGSRPVGAPLRVFNFAYDPGPGLVPPGESPTLANYRFGEAVNMFFWTNRFHDIMYGVGFNELARNFQQNNFGRGGVGNDRVLAEGQDSSGTNNANFLTPPDGTSGRMQMFIFTGTTPDRSSGLDQEIVIHELAHGVSNRLHGNAAGLNFAQGGGMGEGWSDFYARLILSSSGENINGLFGAGGYSTQLIVAGYQNNYYYGIRRFPYALRTTLGLNGRPHNPLTFADVDAAQINLTDGAFPRGPIGSATAHQVHNVGEVWAVTLGEVRARLIALHGFAAGNQRTLQLVIDGMKLNPADPTILNARDSILAASAASGGSAAEEAAIWAGFAARGMGFFATVSAANSAPIVVGENFQVPNLIVTDVEVVNENCLKNGALDPGETVTLAVTVFNPTGAPANNPTIQIVGGGSAGSFRGGIPPGESRVFHVTFTVPNNVDCGDTITLTFNINSSLGPTTSTFNMQIGVATSLGGTTNHSTGNIAVPIPDVTTVDVPINVAQTGRVGDINVRVRLNHTFDGDLVLSLVSPDGTVVPLANNRGGAGDNYGSGANDCSGTFTVFDAQATTAIGAGTAPFAGTFRPDGNLALMNGKQMNGVWRLRVADTAALDVGTVGCAQLQITQQLFWCCGVAGTPVIQAVPPPILLADAALGGRRGNGVPDPGEAVLMRFTMRNVGSDIAQNLRATLLPGGGVSNPSGPQFYGQLIPLGPSKSRDYGLTVNGPCGGIVTATFALDNNGAPLGNVQFTFRLGTPVGGSTQVTNAGAITIPAAGTGAATGAPSSPYPSAINVAGIAGTVTKVTATITNFSHTFPSDVDILLVGPGGQTALLMSDVGGGTDAVNATLTFDDAGAPIGATVVSGTFSPTNSGAGDLFPAPAPIGPYSNTALSVFNGVNPNGTWSLYVVDDAGIDVGSIAGGWSLNFTTLDFVCP